MLGSPRATSGPRQPHRENYGWDLLWVCYRFDTDFRKRPRWSKNVLQRPAGRSSPYARHPVACPPHVGDLPVSAAALDALFQDVIAVSVLTALLLAGYFRLRSRL
jgi:hypothetical protein